MSESEELEEVSPEVSSVSDDPTADSTSSFRLTAPRLINRTSSLCFSSGVSVKVGTYVCCDSSALLFTSLGSCLPDLVLALGGAPGVLGGLGFRGSSGGISSAVLLADPVPKVEGGMQESNQLKCRQVLAGL